MKIVSILFSALFIFTFVKLNAQTTIVLQPDAEKGKDAVIGDCIPCGYYNSNDGYKDIFICCAWTNGGNASNNRSLIEFDLTGIPSGATITSAKLSLYWNPSPADTNIGHSQISGSNTAWLQRITSAWDESTVTWANQPSATTQNQVSLQASTSDTASYPDINVTALVQDMVNNPSASFGFMLKLQTESYYRSLRFASSDCSNAALHPKLEICYTSNNTGINNSAKHEVSIYPNPSNGFINISIDKSIQNGDLYIFNMNGAKVFSDNFFGNEKKILCNLNNGIYLIQITNGSEVWTMKIFID